MGCTVNRKPSPEAMRLTVDRAVFGPVHLAVDGAVNRAVRAESWATVNMTVAQSVGWAVEGSEELAESRVNLARSPHPNLDRIVDEVRQSVGGVARVSGPTTM